MEIKLYDNKTISRLDLNQVSQQQNVQSRSYSIDSKKPFLKFAQVFQKTYLCYDRYRYKLISTGGQTEKVVSDALNTLENTVRYDLVYFNYQESEQVMVMMTATKILYIFNFYTQKMEADGVRIGERPIGVHIEIDQEFMKKSSIIQSKMQSGIPKFKLLNLNQNEHISNFKNGNHFEILYFPNSRNIAFVSQKLGMVLTKLDNMAGGLINVHAADSRICQQDLRFNNECNFYVAQKLTLLENTAATHQCFTQFQPMHLEMSLFQEVKGTKSLNTILLKQLQTTINFEIAEGMFKAIDKDTSPFIKEFILKTHSKSLKTIIAVNLFSSFEIYMVDMINNQKVINLRKMMDNELLTSTRGAHIFSIEVNEEADMFIISTTNHNFMIFSSTDGSHIETKSKVLFNQSILPNRKLFLQGLFGDKSPISADEVYQVKIDAMRSQAVIFDGSKIMIIGIEIIQKMQAEKGYELNIRQYNEEERKLLVKQNLYTENHPYLIDQNLTIFANDELYININKQIINTLKDTVSILKLRRGHFEYNEEIIAGFFTSTFFTKQILKNQFNGVVSLVSQNYVFEASVMLSLLSAIVAQSNKGTLSLLPTNQILGRKCKIDITKEETFKLISPQGISTNLVKSYTTSKFMYTEQSLLLVLLPIFKILNQIKSSNEDESFRNLINQSETFAVNHRLMIIKAHTLIQNYKNSFGHLYRGSPARAFMLLLDGVCEEMEMGNLYSERRLGGLYDIYQSTDSYSDGMHPAEAIEILNGIYGSSPTKPQLFSKSLKVFGSCYEQLNTVEYYTFVKIYSTIIQSAIHSGCLTAKVKLPKCSKIVESWRNHNFIDFEEALQITSQVEYRLFFLSFIPQEKCVISTLNVALQTYLGKSNFILDQINKFNVINGTQSQNLSQLQALMFLAKIYKEIKYSEKIIDKSKNCFYLHLMKLTFSDSEFNNTPQARSQRKQGLSLRLSLSALNYATNTLKLLDPLAPLIFESERILSSLMHKSYIQKVFEKDKYPKIIVYMLQNFNNLSLQDFSERHETALPLGSSPKATKFLLESISMYFEHNAVEVQINKNEIIQSPDISQTILESISLVEFEEMLNKKIRSNELKLDAQNSIKAKLKKIKLSLWRVILLMWYLQCLYLVNNCSKRERKNWKVRKLAIKKFLKLTVKDKPRWGDNELYKIYFSESPESGSGNWILRFVSKALVDPMFNTFAHKLPSIFKFYALSQREQVYENQQSVIEGIIQARYRQVYDQFSKIFGLKFNYSVRLVKDRALAGVHSQEKIQLIKRCPKKWFKTAKHYSFDTLDGTFGSSKLLQTEDTQVSVRGRTASIKLSRAEASTRKSPHIEIVPSEPLEELQIEVHESEKEELIPELPLKESFRDDDIQKEEPQIIVELKSLAVQTSWDSAFNIVPKTERVPLQMADAQIQTSAKLDSKKSEPPKSVREEKVSDVKRDVPPDTTEDSISPQKRIDLQLQEIDQKQVHDNLIHQVKLQTAAVVLAKTLQAKMAKNQYQAFYQIVRKAENNELAKLYDKLQTIDMSATGGTFVTEDKTRAISQPTWPNLESEENQSPLQTLQPSVSNLEEPTIRGAVKIDRPASETRQSKSFRQTTITQKEADKMLYYHLNDRLLQQERRKLTPQRFLQAEPIRERATDLTTSRFGKGEQFLREQYQKQRQDNLITIQNQEADFDFLSGHSSASLSRMSPLVGRPSGVSKQERVTDRKSSPSNVSDNSKLTKFIYPQDHLENLHRQRSPLRRSTSAQFLRNMIQGNDRSFYKSPKAPKNCKISDNLIKFNQKLMIKDFEKLKRGKQESVRNAQKGLIGTQVKLVYNNFVGVKSPEQIRKMIDVQSRGMQKERRQTIKLLRLRK